jgi:hypothetical protein
VSEPVTQRDWLLRRMRELRVRAERLELLVTELTYVHEQIAEIEQRLRRPSPTSVPPVTEEWSRRKDAGNERVLRWAELVDLPTFSASDVEQALGYSHTSACRILRTLASRGDVVRLSPGAYVARSRHRNVVAA